MGINEAKAILHPLFRIHSADFEYCAECYDMEPAMFVLDTGKDTQRHPRCPTHLIEAAVRVQEARR
jgi:hypothetical protein